MAVEPGLRRVWSDRTGANPFTPGETIQEGVSGGEAIWAATE